MIIHLFNSSSVSGPERLVLPALARQSQRFSILNLKEKRIQRLEQTDPLQDFSQSLGLRYDSVPVRGRWDKQAIQILHSRLNALRPELVHAHAIKASVYLERASRKKRKLSFPIVTTHHGVKGLPDWKFRSYEWWYRKRFLNRFDQVLAVSSEDYATLQKSGVRAEVLRLHLNGAEGRPVSPRDRPGKSHEIRNMWLPDTPDRDRLFLFGVVARLSREKDHARIFNVLAQLLTLRQERDWKCLVFGTGDLKDELSQLARKLGLENQIHWMGYREQVGDEMAGLDMLLSFSKAEGLPINLVEAGWAATPVMATRVGGVKDLIPSADYGISLPADEAVETTTQRLADTLTVEGRRRAQAMGARFQQHVLKGFTQENWLETLRALYAELHVEVDSH